MMRNVEIYALLRWKLYKLWLIFLATKLYKQNKTWKCIFGALPGRNHYTGTALLFTCHFMSHCSLPTNRLVCPFVSFPRPPASWRTKTASMENIFFPISWELSLVNQIGKLTFLLIGVSSLMTSSTLTKIGLWHLLHVCMYCIPFPLESRRKLLYYILFSMQCRASTELTALV